MKKYVFLWIVSSVVIVHSVYSQSAADWKWRFPVKASIETAVHNDTHIFISDEARSIFALDKQTGKKIWEITAKSGGKKHQLLLRENTLLLIGEGKNSVQAIDAVTRKPLWNLPLKVGNYPENHLFGNLLLNNDENLKAYDLATGKLKWENADCVVGCAVKVSGDSVFLVGIGGIYAVDPENGKTLWSLKRHGRFMLADDDGASLLLHFDNERKKTFYSLDKKSGKINWQFLDEVNDFSFYTLDSNRVYATNSSSPKITALNPASGKKVWQYELKVKLYGWFDQPTFYKNQAYFGGTDGHLYVFNKTTGKLLRNLKISDGLIKSPFISEHFGYVFEGRNLLKIDLMTGKTLWKFAAFGDIGEIKYEPETIYFNSEFSYNALDLAKIEQAAKSKRPLGALSPTETPPQSEKSERTYIEASSNAPGKISATSKPAISGGKAYFSINNPNNNEAVLYEINLPDGKKRIVAKTKPVSRAAPTIYEGVAYLYEYLKENYGDIREIRTISAIDINSGKTKWSQSANTAIFEGSPQVVGGIVHTATNYNTSFRFDLEGNALKKIESYNFAAQSNFIFGNEENIFYKSKSSEFTALDPETGEAVWKFNNPAPGQTIEGFSELPDSSILLANDHGKMFKISRRTGETIWEKDFSDDSFDNLQTNNGKVFGFSRLMISGSWLMSIDPADGRVIWEKVVKNEGNAQIVFPEENVCLGMSKSLLCYDQTDGRETFSLKSEDDFFAATREGIALFLVNDQETGKPLEIHAVNIKTGRRIWQTDL